MPHKDPAVHKEYMRQYYQRNKEKYKREWTEEQRVRYNKRRSELHTSREGYHKIRAKMVEHLGGQCVKCGATDKLEFNHRDLKDTEQRRQTRGKKGRADCRPTLTEVVSGEANVELLCKECHKKWSAAQKRAAVKLLAELPMDEQIKLTNECLED